MALTHMLLDAGFRHFISEPNVEAGFECFVALTGSRASLTEFHEAVDACLRDGLIREPVRLPEGSLQCHWHLELTPAGVDVARSGAV